MPIINKTERREVLINIIALLAGVLLVTGLSVHVRGGFSGFTAGAGLSIVRWIIMAAVVLLAFTVQYYFFLLLRHSLVKHLFWVLPCIWLFSNGLVAIRRLFESAAEAVILTGFIPITDLAGWLLGMVYWPLLTGGGLVAAVIDSGSQALLPACQVAGVTLQGTDTAGWGLAREIFRFIGMYLDRLGDSFMHEIGAGHLRNRAFFDLSLTGALNLPGWLYSAGYTIACVTG